MSFYLRGFKLAVRHSYVLQHRAAWPDQEQGIH
jgi:hypothetical protein